MRERSGSRVFLAGIGGAVLGIVLTLGVQAMLDAYRRSTAKHSAGQCVLVSEALESYRRDHGAYPPLEGGMQGLSPHLVPKYLRQLPRESAMSGEPYLVFMNGSSAVVIAPGQHGAIAAGGKLLSSPTWER